MLCMLLYDPESFHSQTSNANANRALVPLYGNVRAAVHLRVVEKRCQTSCTTSTTMRLYSYKALSASQCAFSISLVEFHIPYDEPFSLSGGCVFITILSFILTRSRTQKGYSGKTARKRLGNMCVGIRFDIFFHITCTCMHVHTWNTSYFQVDVTYARVYMYIHICTQFLPLNS